MSIYDHPTFLHQLNIFFISLFFAVVTNIIAYRKGYFHLPRDEGQVIYPILTLKTLCGAFLAFLLSQIILIPVIFTLFTYLMYDTTIFEMSFETDPIALGWFNLLAMIGSCSVLLLYTQLLPHVTRSLIWRRNKNIFKVAAIGAVTWFLAYPLVMAVGQAISLLIYFLFGIEEIDQVAVQSLKMVWEHPVLYFGTIVTMFTVVPVSEELLFRGFLQTWLRGLFGRKRAIVGASMIFAFFHFSLSQGASNISYLIALFFLSCFLGLLYEKWQSLLAPITLHATFNGMSLIIIALS